MQLGLSNQPIAPICSFVLSLKELQFSADKMQKKLSGSRWLKAASLWCLTAGVELLISLFTSYFVKSSRNLYAISLFPLVEDVNGDQNMWIFTSKIS